MSVCGEKGTEETRMIKKKRGKWINEKKKNTAEWEKRIKVNETNGKGGKR